MARCDSCPIVVKLGFDIEAELAPGGPAEQLVRRGRRVVLADLRGMGDDSRRDRPGRQESPLGSDVKAAFLSLHIGRPLLGQRVIDLLCLLDSLKESVRATRRFPDSRSRPPARPVWRSCTPRRWTSRA